MVNNYGQYHLRENILIPADGPGRGLAWTWKLIRLEMYMLLGLELYLNMIQMGDCFRLKTIMEHFVVWISITVLWVAISL